MTPEFYGGDYTYPNTEECLFYSTNALHVCTVEPCLNGSYTGKDAQAGGAAVWNGGSSYTAVPIGTSTVVTGNGSSNTPCVNGTCSSGQICAIDGYCYTAKKSNNGFGPGAVAAIVFACFVLVFVLVAVIFFALNKSEIPFMRPFKGHVSS